MLDHICIGVADLARSKRFYTAALAPLGYRITVEEIDAVGFGVAEGNRRSTDPGGEFWIASGAPVPPLTHLAFNAGTRQEVDAFFRAATGAGGGDNGEPGLRPRYHENYYACFIIDPDGYNIEAVCHEGP